MRSSAFTNRLSSRSAGFTIIEVMIVLVIAAVILLIVFLAVPALQRNSRNNQRNNEARRVGATFIEWLSNGNTLPGTTFGSNQSVADQIFADANGQIYTRLRISTTNASVTSEPGNTTQIQIRINRMCNDEGTDIGSGSSANRYALVYMLEPSAPRCIQVR